MAKKMRPHTNFGNIFDDGINDEELVCSSKTTVRKKHEDEFALDFDEVEVMFGGEEVVTVDEFYDDLESEEEPELDRRKKKDRRKGKSAECGGRRSSDRRKKTPRRRQIDPTTCERDYSPEEVEFMNAFDEYKRSSGRMFPTCSEILEVIKSLGYVKLENASAAIAEETQPEELGTNDPVSLECRVFSDEYEEQPSTLKKEATPIFHDEHAPAFPEVAIFTEEFHIESETPAFTF